MHLTERGSKVNTKSQHQTGLSTFGITLYYSEHSLRKQDSLVLLFSPCQVFIQLLPNVRSINCWEQTATEASPIPAHCPNKLETGSLSHSSAGHMIFALFISQLTGCNKQICNLKVSVGHAIYQKDFYSFYFIFNSAMDVNFGLHTLIFRDETFLLII